MRIRWADLEPYAGSAERMAENLADLASWVLPPPKRARLGVTPPRLPCEPGAAVVLFRTLDSIGGTRPPAGLARAFGLPFRWRSGENDSRHLPRAMHELAERVRTSLDVTDRWGLGLDDPYHARYDLSKFPVGAESGWAPLAAALLVARDGGRPDPTVFATGKWTGSGIGDVAGIPEKVEAAIALSGGEGTPVLWVPKVNGPAARRRAGRRCCVKSFPSGDGHGGSARPEKLLSGLLLDLDAPPSSAAPLADRLAWANRDWVVADDTIRRPYYLEHLLPDLADHVRRNSPPAGRPVRRMATSLGRNVPVTALTLRVLQPAEVRILATGDDPRWVASLAEHMRGTDLRIPAPDRFDLADPGGTRRLIESLASWLAEAPDGAGAVDITAGTKAMSTALVTAALHARARVLYLDHSVVPKSNRPEYGTQQRVVELDWATAGDGTISAGPRPTAPVRTKTARRRAMDPRPDAPATVSSAPGSDPPGGRRR